MASLREEANCGPVILERTGDPAGEDAESICRVAGQNLTKATLWKEAVA